jgi:hypothetical protein
MTGRSYNVDGIRLPSVTTIIERALPNPGIVAWKLRVGEDEARRISREATDHGTGIHALVERVGRRQEHLLTADEATLIAPYARWVDEHVSMFLGVEQLLISRQHGYAGTTDAIAILNGDRYPAIVDFKTSKTALGMAEWRLQTAAYCIAAEEHLGLICRRRVIVRLSRTEPHKLHVHELPEDELATDKQVFLALLHVFSWMREREPVPNSIGRITLRRRT